MSNNSLFDDYLGLTSRDLSQVQLLLFTGVSGSGKTSYIRYLLRTHKSFVSRQAEWMIEPFIDRGPCADRSLVVLDDLTSWKHAGAVMRYLCRGTTVMAASHLPILAMRSLVYPWRSLCYSVDKYQTKISHYLESRGVSYTPEAVTAFYRQYGANYTDVDIILEYTGENDFTVAMQRFGHRCALTRG